MKNRFAPPRPALKVENSVVFRRDDSFCAWPFVCGFWKTASGDYLTAFQKKPAAYTRPEDVHHDEVAKIGPKIMTVRTTDSGRSWNEDSLQPIFELGDAPGEQLGKGQQDYSDLPRIDFTDRNVLVASGGTPDYFRPHSRAWIRVSTDGGHNWRRPIIAPMVGLASLSGHASSLVREDGTSLIFFTAVRSPCSASNSGNRPDSTASLASLMVSWAADPQPKGQGTCTWI